MSLDLYNSLIVPLPLLPAIGPHGHKASRSGKDLLGEDVKKRERLGDAELEPELGAVVVVEDWAEGVLLQWVADLPRRDPHLRTSTPPN